MKQSSTVYANGAADLPQRQSPISGADWISLLLAIVAVLLPFWFVTYPPLHDYPFHLARMQILHSLGSGDFLDQIYRLNTWALPNVAMDLALYGLSRLVDDVRLAGLLYVAGLQVFTVGGVAFLRWTLQRRIGLAPLLAAIFVHNWVFLFGFLNYLSGLALFLWCFALWIRQLDGSTVLRLLVGTLSAAILFFCHFLAFAVFALGVTALELQRAIENRRTGFSSVVRFAISGLPLIPPLMFFVWLSPTGRVGGAHILRQWYHWVDIAKKPVYLLQSSLSGDMWVDLATMGLLIVGACVLAWCRPSIRLDRRLILPLAALCVLPVVAPFGLFGAWWIDFRLFLPAVYVAIAGIQIELRRQSWRALLAIGVATLVVGRAIAFSASWSTYARVVDQYTAAFRALPHPATLYVAYGEKSPTMRDRLILWSDRWNPPLKHIVSLASLVADIYVPATWADPAQQPVVVRERYRPSYVLQIQNPKAISRSAEMAGFVAQIRAVHRAGGHPPGPVLILLWLPDGVDDVANLPGAAIASGKGFIIFSLPMD